MNLINNSLSIFKLKLVFGIFFLNIVFMTEIYALAPKSHLLTLEKVKEEVAEFAVTADFYELSEKALRDLLSILQKVKDSEDKEVLSYVHKNLLQKFFTRIIYALNLSSSDDYNRMLSAMINTGRLNNKKLNVILKSINHALKIKELWSTKYFVWGYHGRPGQYPDLKVAIFDWGQTLSPLANNKEAMGKFFRLLTEKYGLKVCICTAGVTEDQIRVELDENNKYVGEVWSTEAKASKINSWISENNYRNDEVLFADDSIENFKGFTSRGLGSDIATIKIVPKNDLAQSELIRSYISSFNGDEFDPQLKLWDNFLSSLKGSGYIAGNISLIADCA